MWWCIYALSPYPQPPGHMAASTGTGECSWYDFACKIAEYSGYGDVVKPCTSEEYPSPTKRPAYSSLRNLALECTVGDQMRDWQTALKEYILKVED